MSLSDEDIKQIASAVAVAVTAAHPPESVTHTGESKGAMDMLMKVAVSLCTAGMLALITMTIQGNTQQQLMTQQQFMMNEKIGSLEKRFDAFAATPRFDKEDFRSEMVPVNQIISRHTVELGDRKEWIRQADDRFQALERRIDRLTPPSSQTP